MVMRALKALALQAARRPLTKKVLHRLLYFASVTEGEVLRDRELQFLGHLMSRAHASNSQMFQDEWVIFETGGKRGGFFVEFGAADGRYISNTWRLERDYGWNGILSEPAPAWHAALARNRTCRISHKCVWTKTGETLSFRQAADPALSTLDDFAGRDGHAQARADAAEICVETVSLTDLLDECRAPATIDYVSIDTEGSELAILGAFDFARYDVRLLSVEHNRTGNEAKLDAFLDAKGFERCFPQFSLIDGWYRNRRASGRE